MVSGYEKSLDYGAPPPPRGFRDWLPVIVLFGFAAILIYRLIFIG